MSEDRYAQRPIIFSYHKLTCDLAHLEARSSTSDKEELSYLDPLITPVWRLR